MPRRYTMATLVTRCQQRCDLENDDSIATAIWKSFISEVYGELWSEISLTGRRYFETSTTVAATGATSYTEPTGHLSTVKICRVLDGGFEEPLRELSVDEQPHYRGLTGEAKAWALVDDQLFLYPNPSSGSYKWYYTQQPTDLSSYADGDVVDVVTASGEAFLIWGVAVLALAKQQKSVELALMQKERHRELVQVWAANRNLHEAVQRDELSPDDNTLTVPGAGWSNF